MTRLYRLTAAALLAVLAAATATVTAQGRGFKVAFYNIRSGEGIQGLKGRATPFAATSNCDEAKGAVNAWGAGLVQKELARAVGNDAAVVALGLAEAWKCGSARNVRTTLGWKQDSADRNGVALLARYGFARDPEWLQLDTTQNKNPRDTMWVVHGAVCVDARCSGTVDVYATHWSGTGPQALQTFDRQAQQTVEFMAKAGGPHVLVGDLNVWEGDAEVCRQRPNNQTLAVLRRAGYVDAWPAVHGRDEGYTGMVNRNGCGQPNGYVWKRIDYAWSKGLTPRAIDRFGMVPPGDPAPSDHYGILVSY
jgi:exonuclease III